jgi:peptide/nickel transport system substrate-binding protein
MIINPAKLPFVNIDLRRAMALSLDSRASIDIIIDGQGDIGGSCCRRPRAFRGIPQEVLQTLPGYDPDV